MIYRFLLFLSFILLFGTCVLAQNLVVNGGFEERELCIPNNSDIGDAIPWFNPVLTPQISAASPDVFHECAVVNTDDCPSPYSIQLGPWLYGVPTNSLGCEHPHSGVGYAGLFCFYPNPDSELGFREYLAVPLAEPLLASDIYEVKLWVSLADLSTHAIWSFQVLFTNVVIHQNDLEFPITANPQLDWAEGDYIANQEGWRELSWNYTAEGGEQYMYLGNFRSNALTDTLRLADPDTLVAYYYPGAYYYVDDVSVQRSTLSTSDEESQSAIYVFPNPVLHDVQITSQKDIILAYRVLDVTGKVMDSGPVNALSHTVALEHLPPGMYFLELSLNKGSKTVKKVMKR